MSDHFLISCYNSSIQGCAIHSHAFLKRNDKSFGESFQNITRDLRLLLYQPRWQDRNQVPRQACVPSTCRPLQFCNSRKPFSDKTKSVFSGTGQCSGSVQIGPVLDVGAHEEQEPNTPSFRYFVLLVSFPQTACLLTADSGCFLGPAPSSPCVARGPADSVTFARTEHPRQNTVWKGSLELAQVVGGLQVRYPPFTQLFIQLIGILDDNPNTLNSRWALFSAPLSELQGAFATAA